MSDMDMKVEVCDARDDDSSALAGLIIKNSRMTLD
jgi:hypothetical protein